MNVAIQRTTDRLDQGYCASLGEVDHHLGFFDEMSGAGAIDAAKDHANDASLVGTQKSHGATRWWMGNRGSPLSTNRAALSARRRAPPLGQQPRRVQLNATSRSASQPVQRTRAGSRAPDDPISNRRRIRAPLMSAACRPVPRGGGLDVRVMPLDDLIAQRLSRATAKDSSNMLLRLFVCSRLKSEMQNAKAVLKLAVKEPAQSAPLG